MTINIKGTNIELTSAIKEYTEKRIESLQKFLRGTKEEIIFAVEIGKTTNHHKQGDVFKAEINFTEGGGHFYAVSETGDLYSAIDRVKEDIERQLTQTKGRNETLFRRGARSVKKMMKGLSKRNPFTSKY